MIVLAAFSGWGNLAQLLRMPRVWVMGAGVAAYMLMFFAAVQQAGAALASLVSICLAPLFTAAGARLVGKPWPGRQWFTGTVLALTGVALLAWPDAGITGSRVMGVIFAAGASADRGVTPLHSLAASFGIGALLCLPFLTADAHWLSTGRGIALVLWLGLAATTAAYWLFGYGLSRLKPGVVATLTLSEPAMATVLGVGVLGEVMSVRGWLGCAVIAVALVITARSR